MMLRVCCALLAVVVLPIYFEAITGCGFAPRAVCDTDTDCSHPSQPNAYMCACTCSPAQRHRDLRVSFPEDDAEQRLDNVILLNSPDLDFENGRFIGLRFRGVGIPPGAAILHAKVQFTARLSSAAAPLTVQIAGEATDNAALFSTAPGSLGALPITASKVSWSLPAAWTAGTAGPDQLTPELASVLQEVVNRPGWAEGNTLALIIRGTAGSALRQAFSQDGEPAAAALLSVDYTDPSAPIVGPFPAAPICVLPADNQNAGGMAPDDAKLIADCTGRVQATLSGLNAACGYPADCTCSVQADCTEHQPDCFRFSDKCDQDLGSGAGVCVANPIITAADCNTKYNPPGMVTATNVKGNGDPVCLANSALTAGLFGRRTSCDVAGTATVKVGDDSETSHTTGTVQFVGDPCPGQSCGVGMEYLLNLQDSVTFGNFFHHETFTELGGVGENVAGKTALLSSAGDGTFDLHELAASGQGRRGSDKRGLATTNQDVVDVNVGWGQMVPMCKVKGSLIGSVDPELKRCENAGPTAGKICQKDSDCTNDAACSDGVCNCEAVGSSDLALSLDVSGHILNQPPTADAGGDKTVECTTAGVTNVILDGSDSSDPDGNIALYSWFRGSRIGPEVGFEELSTVEQSLGSQSYVLRVIDEFGEADEDTAMVTVADTTPAVVTCAVTIPTLSATSHNLMPVGLMASAVDTCEGVRPVTVNVFSDEDDQDLTTDGVFSPDAKDIAVGTLRLRAEQKKGSDGRVYLIITSATDSSSNRGFNCCTVSVPALALPSLVAQKVVHDQAEAARTFCLANHGTPPAGYFPIGDGPVVGSKQ